MIIIQTGDLGIVTKWRRKSGLDKTPLKYFNDMKMHQRQEYASIYTSDIASLLASQAMLGQLYADDVQAYQHCPASDALVTVSAMSRTMEALGSWMSSNRLRLTPHKTQFIWLGTRQHLTKLDMVALTFAFPHFTFSSTVRDLGVTLDQELLRRM